MKENKSLTCVVCPVGCQIDLCIEDGAVTHMKGFSCSRGQDYAKAEVIDPRRILTTTVKVRGGMLPVVPVKSDKTLPRNILLECMKVVSRVELIAPLPAGTVAVHDILGTGVNIVTTKCI